MKSDNQRRHTPPPEMDADREGLVLLPDDGSSRPAKKPENARRYLVLFFAACLAVLLLDILFLLHRPHKHLSFEEGLFPAEDWFGFYSLYGLGAPFLMAAVAILWRKLVTRPEDADDR